MSNIKLFIKFTKKNSNMPADFLHLQTEIEDHKIILDDEYIQIIEYTLTDELNASDTMHLDSNNHIKKWSDDCVESILSDSNIIDICEKYVYVIVELEENEELDFFIHYDFCLTSSDTIFDYSKLNNNTKLKKYYYAGNESKGYEPVIFYKIIN